MCQITFYLNQIFREGRVMGQLEVSRSIGDGPYKNHGVSSVPDVKRCQLMDNDRCSFINVNIFICKIKRIELRILPWYKLLHFSFTNLDMF